MYPTLYHAFYDLFGVEWPALKLVNSFGFFVALAFLAASALLTRELKRKGAEGVLPVEKRKRIVGKPASLSDIAFNAGMGFLFGWKIIYLLLNARELFTGNNRPTDFIFSGDGYPILGLLLGAGFGVWRWWTGNKNKLDQPREEIVDYHKWEYTGNITLVAAIGGITGAKFFHLFENPDEFMMFFREPSVDNFLSGLTIYGGLIIGGLAVWLYARRVKIPMGHLCDATAPGLILAYGIGRIGCQVSGDGDWGIANTAAKPGWIPEWLWSYRYPNNVNAVRFENPDGGYAGKLIPKVDPTCDAPVCEGIIDGQVVDIYQGYGTYLDPGVFPTPVYETAMALAIFGILWALRKRFKAPLLLFAAYLMFNGIERFLIEKIRVNNKMDFLGMEITQAELISTVFFLCGLALLLFIWRRRDHYAAKYGPDRFKAPANAGGAPES